jgi:mono/diheme cytochrome c family protein
VELPNRRIAKLRNFAASRGRSAFRRFGDSAIRQSFAGFAAVAMLALAGCRTDMQLQPKILPLTQSDFYSDGRGSRTPPDGTVARGQLRDDSYFYTGMINGKPGDMLPFPMTRADLERGRERFNIYCSPCHSRLGDGNGMIVQRGYRRPPSFHSQALRQAPLGHFFDVMTNGFGAMPDYAAQVPSADRWRIAAYIRALQLSQAAPASDVPAGQKVPSAPLNLPSTMPTGATLVPGAQSPQTAGAPARPGRGEKK